MIDYKSCDKLIDLLDKGDLKKLRRYINDERKKYYISNARKALHPYLKRHFAAYYDTDFTMCKLLLTDYCSAYFLESDEILTEYEKKKRRYSLMTHPDSYKIIDLYEKLEVNQVAVKEIVKDASGKRDKKTLIDLKTKEGQIYTFYEDEFSFTEKFLGDDVEYSVSLRDPKLGGVCLVKSKKGTGIIFGRKEI